MKKSRLFLATVLSMMVLAVSALPSLADSGPGKHGRGHDDFRKFHKFDFDRRFDHRFDHRFHRFDDDRFDDDRFFRFNDHRFHRFDDDRFFRFNDHRFDDKFFRVW